MISVEVPEGNHNSLEEHIENAEKDIEEDEATALHGVGEFRSQISAAADHAEQAANVQIADALVRDVVSAAKKAETNPFEALSRNFPAPVLDALVQRRDTILSAATDAEVGAAHSMFLEAVFGVDMSTVKAEDRAAASNKLVTEMIHRVRGEAMPPSGDPKADAYVESLVDVWKEVDDAGFWYSMASQWEGNPITAEEAKSHLLFLRAVGDLTPPAEVRESFVWRGSPMKLLVVEKIAAAGKAAPDPTADPQGRIDIAAMYRQAGKSTSLGHPVPRDVATELVRLALVNLVGGVVPVSQKVSIISKPSRELVGNSLMSEKASGVSGETLTAEAIVRNATRSAALDLLSTTDTTVKSFEKNDKNDQRYAIRIQFLAIPAECFREGRRDLGGVFQHLTDSMLLAFKRQSDNTALAGLLGDVVSRSGLVDALTKWSDKYASGTTGLPGIQEALGDLKIRMKAIVDSVATSEELESDATKLMPMRYYLDAIGTEVARQAAELIAVSNGGPRPDAAPPLGGALSAIDISSSTGRTRRAAVLAREKGKGLGGFAGLTLKRYLGVPWAEAVKDAAIAWTVADQTDVATMLQSAPALASALDAASGTLANASVEERYIGSSVIDAIAVAAMDRIQMLAATGGEVTQTQSDALVKALSTSVISLADPPDLANLWSKGKDTVAGKLPSDLNLDLTGRIKGWMACLAARPIDLAALSTRTFSIVQAVSDYRTRIDAGTNTPADKAILLQLLDTVLAAMQTRLNAITSK